jgi:thioredoxin-like negative regulator of GroEL
VSIVATFTILVPTFILLEDGKEINRITGAKTREELEDFINHEKTIPMPILFSCPNFIWTKSGK